MTQTLRVKGAPRFWRIGDGAPPAGAHVALVPGAAAPLLPLDIPAKLKGAARENVAARQLTEQLSIPAGQIEMHPYRAHRATAWHRAAVIGKDAAAAWRSKAARSCAAILPDYFALPAAPDLWTLETSGGKMVARLGPDDGFGAEVEIGLAQLAEASKPRAVLRLGDANAALDDALAALNVPIHKDLRALRKAGIKILPWRAATGGLNLGAPPSGAGDRMAASVAQWRVPVMAGLLAFMAWAGTIWITTDQARSQAAETKADIDALVRAHFLPTGPILDARAQIAPIVAAATQPKVVAQQGIPPLEQLHIAAATLTRPTARPLRVSYAPQTGLQTEIAADDFAALDALVLDLQNLGFLVEQIDSGTQQSGGVLARLRLELLE